MVEDQGGSKPASKQLPFWNFSKSLEGSHPCLVCTGVFPLSPRKTGELGKGVTFPETRKKFQKVSCSEAGMVLPVSEYPTASVESVVPVADLNNISPPRKLFPGARAHAPRLFVFVINMLRGRECSCIYLPFPSPLLPSQFRVPSKKS